MESRIWRKPLRRFPLVPSHSGNKTLTTQRVNTVSRIPGREHWLAGWQDWVSGNIHTTQSQGPLHPLLLINTLLPPGLSASLWETNRFSWSWWENALLWAWQWTTSTVSKISENVVIQDNSFIRFKDFFKKKISNINPLLKWRYIF